MPWTRDHERLVEAWEQLGQANALVGLVLASSPSAWVQRKFGVHHVARLMPAQAREARRNLHAWRAGVEGRSEPHAYPRQWRRNGRRRAAQRAA
jgi:hypothetical protein